jgi:ribosomal-protein-alanine N-acetyltransferase
VSFSVRAMTVEDIDSVLMLASRFVEAPHWTSHYYEQMLLPASPATLIRWSVVAQADGGLAGFAVASWLRQEAAAEIEGLVVDEQYRRQGMGSALIVACMEWAAKSGASSMRLEVRASNAAALLLYQCHGFSVVGHRRAYYSAPVEDALLLQTPLGSQNTT